MRRCLARRRSSQAFSCSLPPFGQSPIIFFFSTAPVPNTSVSWTLSLSSPLFSCFCSRWYRALNALKAMHTMQKLTFPETVPGELIMITSIGSKRDVSMDMKLEIRLRMVASQSPSFLPCEAVFHITALLFGNPLKQTSIYGKEIERLYW